MWFFHVQIEGYVCLLRRHPMGMEDHKNITDVLKAIQEIDHVQPLIPEALNEEAATPTQQLLRGQAVLRGQARA